MSFLIAFGMAWAGDRGQIGDRGIGRAAILAGVLGLFAAFVEFVFAFVWAVGMAVTRYGGEVGN